jgi:hypothetical protein
MSDILQKAKRLAVKEQEKESSMESQQTNTESQATRRPRTRIGHDRSRLVRTLEEFARAISAPFDPPTLAHLADISDDEYHAIRDRLIAMLAAGIDGIGNSPVPPLDVQFENFRAWQAAHTTYFHWDDTAMDALRQKLERLGPGCELIPCFAMSVQIKLPNGRLILINRRGEETKS